MSTRRAERTGIRLRRGPVIVLVAAALALAVAAGNGTRRGASAAANVRAGVSLPAADAISASWFCAAGTSSPGGRAPETVVVASAADTTIQVTVTVMPGNAAPVSRAYRVEPHALLSVPVADVDAVPEPGVVVEVVGGQAAVAEQLVHDSDTATEPCTRRAAADWYFGVGTTAKGTAHYLELFNPFGDDAIVDVTFLTDSGVQQLDDLQGLVVPRRSRVTVAVHDELPRQAQVATWVHARTGRVVAEHTEIFDGTAPDNGPARTGLAVALGAEAPATTWVVPGLTAAGGASTALGVANFGDHDTSVEVSEVVDDGTSAPAQTVAVPAQSVVFVDTGARVASGHAYSVVVHARSAEGVTDPVVVEALSSWPVGASPTGAAAAAALVVPARRWVVVLPDVGGPLAVTVVVPGTRAAHVTLSPAGALDTSTKTGSSGAGASRTVKAGQMVTIPLGSRSARRRPIVVTADEPVFVEVSGIGAGGTVLAGGVPDLAAVNPS